MQFDGIWDKFKYDMENNKKLQADALCIYKNTGDRQAVCFGEVDGELKHYIVDFANAKENEIVYSIPSETIKEENPKCQFCIESDYDHIEKVQIIFKHTNPKAYGYPEVCHWDKSFNAYNCPVCGRKLKNIKHE